MIAEMLIFILLMNLAATFFVTGIAWLAFAVPQGTAKTSVSAMEPPSRSGHVSSRGIQWAVWLMNWSTMALLIGVSRAEPEVWLVCAGLFVLMVASMMSNRDRSAHSAPLMEKSDGISQQTLESRHRLPILLTSLRAILVFWITLQYTTSADGGTMSAKLKVGDPAPQFTATTADGQRVGLSDYIGKRGLVIFFYPKNGTAVCTKEACAFRDSYEKFVDANVEVIGVSSDSNASHQSFAGTHKLSYPLISDADGSLKKLFGVQKTLGIIPGRVTYVIDKEGIIRMIFSAQLASDEHVQKALAVVGESSDQPASK